MERALTTFPLNITERTIGKNLINTSVDHVHTNFFSETSIIILDLTYITVFTIGMLANIVIFISMIIYRQMSRSIYLYTFNLAICDLLILLFYIPTQLVYIKDQLVWKMGEEVCKLVNIILPITLTCTIGTLLAIAFDRARGLLRPFDWKANSVKRAKLALPVIWLISIVINIPLLIYPRLESSSSVEFCSEGWPDFKDGEVFWVCIFGLVFCLPLVTMIATYIVMIYVIRKKIKIRFNQRHHKKMLKMCISLLVVFAICTGFQHFFFFVTSTFSGVQIPIKTLHYLYVVSNFFVSLQASINPFIYGSLHEKCTCRQRKGNNFRSGVTAHIRSHYANGEETVKLHASSSPASGSQDYMLEKKEHPGYKVTFNISGLSKKYSTKLIVGKHMLRNGETLYDDSKDEDCEV